MVITVIWNFSASSRSSVVRIIVPSSRIISQQSPLGFNPASTARSTVASVCPVRFKTPPSLASNGNICPGLRKSSGFASSFIAAIAVSERSNADIPVSVCIPSIDMVNAVWWLSVFCSTICFNPSFWHNSLLIGMQIKPFPWVAIKLIFSGVANSVAQIKSPSFSRSGSSMTMTIFPCLISATACSTVSIFLPIFYLPPYLSLSLEKSMLHQKIF